MELDIIYQEDCFEALKRIEDKSIDLILTDPPYGVTACKWDIVPDLDRLWVELKRVGKDNCAYVFTASQPFTTDLINSNRKWFKYEWIWHKNEGSNFVSSKYMPIKYHENVLVFYYQKPTYNPQRMLRWSEQSRQVYKRPVGSGKALRSFGTLKNIGNVQYDASTKSPESIIDIRCVPNGGGHKLHPTQKPVTLFEYLIKTYTNENDTVLDPFIGSGTTAIACINLNRRYIGCELEKKYYDIAIKRVEGVL